MADSENLKHAIKVCMFDQYGTVVDMQGGLTKVAAPFLKSKGSPIEAVAASVSVAPGGDILEDVDLRLADWIQPPALAQKTVGEGASR